MVSEDPKNKEQDKKNFYIDTSALMLNPLSIFQLASCPIPKSLITNPDTKFSKIVDESASEIISGSPNNIYISPLVEWELNNIKDNDKKSGLSRQAAKTAIDVLANIRVYGAKKNEYLTREGIKLDNGSIIKIVDYDENKFIKDNKHLYEPNRDDRILYNYISHIKNEIEESHKNKKELHKNKNFEIVTEDINFMSKIIDTIGKENLDVKCNFLISERTQTANASKKYNGILPIKIQVPLSEYKQIVSNKKVSYTLEEIAKLSNKDKSLFSEMLPNGFIEVIPNEEELSGLPDNYYLKKKGNSLVNLYNYSNFLSEMKNNSFMLSNKDLKKVDIMDLTPKNKGIIYRILNDSNLDGGVKKQLRKKLKRNLNKESLNNILARIKENSDVTTDELVTMLKEDMQKPEKDRMLSRDEVLSKPMHYSLFPIYEQRAYVELLSDPEIELVTFTGPQGTGKTLFALYQGLLEVKKGLRDKIVYMRPLTPTGEDIGALPGDINKKTAPAMQSCYDALAKIYMIDEKKEFFELNPEIKPENTQKALEKLVNELTRNNILETEIISYIQGRTISNAYYIIDEAQIFSRAQLKLLVGRAGEGTKLIVIGDFDQLSATNASTLKKYEITVDNSGLSHLIESMMKRKNNYFIEHKINRDLYGHVSINYPFTKRSKVSELAQHF